VKRTSSWPVGCRDAQLEPDRARTDHDVIDTGPERDTDVVVTATATASKLDVVAQSRRSDAALTTATATPLALKIAESNIKVAIAGKTNKRPFDVFVFDVFAESDCEDDKTNEAAAAAVGCRKRSRRGDVVINDIVKRRARPLRSARLFTLEGPQSHQSNHEESLRAPEVERAGTGSEECPVVIEVDPADGVSEAGVADAGSDGGQTGTLCQYYRLHCR
jgi:hypothetical protein